MLVAVILLLASVVMAVIRRSVPAELLALWAIGVALVAPSLRLLLH